MDYTILGAELGHDPLAIGYAAMTDAQCAEALNAATQAVVRRVPVAEMMDVALGTGLYVALKVAQRSVTDPVLLAMVDTVLDLRTSPVTAIDVYAADGTPDAATSTMFDAFAQTGIMTAEQRAAIEALAWDGGASRAVQLVGGVISAADVTAARLQLTQAAQKAQRLADYAALRVRLMAGYNAACAWLQAQQDADEAVPTWAELLGRV